jgi:hypothetical protein
VALFGALGLTSAALAEPPAGAYAIPVGGGSRLTLAHGEAELCEVEKQGEFCTATTTMTTASGLVHGTGTLSLTGDFEGSIALQFGGRLHGTTAKPRVRVEMTGDGAVSDGSATFDVSADDGKMKCKLDPAQADRFLCKAWLRLCAVVGGRSIDCTRLKFPVALAAETAPPFTVNLELESDADGRISGTSLVQVDVGSESPNDSEIEFAVSKGKYKASSDRSNIAFRWAFGDESNKLALKKIALEAGTATSGTIVFNVAGQKGKFEIAP